MNTQPEVDHVKELIKKHFLFPNQYNNHNVVFLSTTEICNYLTKVTNQHFSLRIVGLRMKAAGYAHEVKNVEGVNKRGYFVVNPEIAG